MAVASDQPGEALGKQGQERMCPLGPLAVLETHVDCLPGNVESRCGQETGFVSLIKPLQPIPVSTTAGGFSTSDSSRPFLQRQGRCVGGWGGVEVGAL